MSSKPDPIAAQANDVDDLDTQVLGRLQNRGDVGRAKNLKTRALTEAGASALVGDGNVLRTGMPPAEAVEPEGRNNDQAADNPASIEFASVDESASGTAPTVTPEVASVLHVPGDRRNRLPRLPPDPWVGFGSQPRPTSRSTSRSWSTVSSS